MKLISILSLSTVTDKIIEFVSWDFEPRKTGGRGIIFQRNLIDGNLVTFNCARGQSFKKAKSINNFFSFNETLRAASKKNRSISCNSNPSRCRRRAWGGKNSTEIIRNLSAHFCFSSLNFRAAWAKLEMLFRFTFPISDDVLRLFGLAFRRIFPAFESRVQFERRFWGFEIYEKLSRSWFWIYGSQKSTI